MDDDKIYVLLRVRDDMTISEVISVHTTLGGLLERMNKLEAETGTFDMLYCKRILEE